MSVRRRRMIAVALVLVGISAAAALGLTAFQKNLLFFYSPTQLMAGEAPAAGQIRLGGLVVKGSVVRETGGLQVRFTLTDMVDERRRNKTNTVEVVYEGILPDLFREGQGIIAQGRMQPERIFEASEVLAKHDENYMPPEVAAAITEAGADRTLR